MKKKIIIEYEIPDKYDNIFPEEGQSDEDFEGKEKQKELDEFRKKFTRNVEETLDNSLKNYIKEFEEYFFNYEMEEISIENWDDLEDYDIKINIKSEAK